MTRKKTREEHVAELAVHGRVELVGDYVNAHTKTLYRCLEHGEIHEARASSCSGGAGLHCCIAGSVSKRNDEMLSVAEQRYKAAIKRFGKVVQIDPYAGVKKPILHLCLAHGEVHKARPSNLRKGQGLACCKKAESGLDTLDKSLAGTYRFATSEASSLYLYGLANHPGYIKPGISKDCGERARLSLGRYGPQVCSWERERRTSVFLVEQVLLKATRLMAHCPSALAGWAGATEVRRMDADALVDMAQELMDEMDACANPWEFAIAHGLLTKAQEKRARVLIRAGVISEAELAAVEVAA